MNSPATKTVLIVEDEILLADVLEEYLQASAFEVERIDDGNAVVPWVRSSPPDLILLDLMLPGRDGFEICRELRVSRRSTDCWDWSWARMTMSVNPVRRAKSSHGSRHNCAVSRCYEIRWKRACNMDFT